MMCCEFILSCSTNHYMYSGINLQKQTGHRKKKTEVSFPKKSTFAFKNSILCGVLSRDVSCLKFLSAKTSDTQFTLSLKPPARARTGRNKAKTLKKYVPSSLTSDALTKLAKTTQEMSKKTVFMSAN